LAEKGIGLARAITEERWGRVTAIKLGGGTELGLYQPSHRRPERHVPEAVEAEIQDPVRGIGT
jgi:hypothetical protein